MPIMRTSVVSKNLYCTNGDGKNELKHYSTRQSHRHHLNNVIWWKRRRRSYNLSTDVQLFPFSLLVTKLHSNILSRLESFPWKPHCSFSLNYFSCNIYNNRANVNIPNSRAFNQNRKGEHFHYWIGRINTFPCEDHYASYMGFAVERAIADIVSSCNFFTNSCVK